MYADNFSTHSTHSSDFDLKLERLPNVKIKKGTEYASILSSDTLNAKINKRFSTFHTTNKTV